MECNQSKPKQREGFFDTRKCWAFS